MQQIKLFFKDFSRLIAVHYRENWWVGLFAIGALSVVTIYKYINIINIYSNIGWNQELLTIFNHNRELCTALIVFITAVYSFACTLKTYGDKERIHDAMMLPASHKAKFFAEVLYSLVLLPLIMFVILFVTDIATALICQNSEENIVLINADKEYIYSLPSYLYAILFFHSITTLWRADNSHIAVRTMVVMTILFLAFYVNTPLTYPFIWSDFTEVTREGLHIVFNMEISWASSELGKILHNLIYGTLPIMLYAISYYKHKERSL